MLLAIAMAVSAEEPNKALIAVSAGQQIDRKELFRGALPPREPRLLLGENGPTIQLQRKDRLAYVTIPLSLDVATSGVPQCRLGTLSQGATADPAVAARYAAAACREILAAGKWTPALSRDGTRRAADYRIRLVLTYRRPFVAEERRSSIVDHMLFAPPAPPSLDIAELRWNFGFGSTFSPTGLPAANVDRRAVAEGVTGWAGLALLKGSKDRFECAAPRSSGSAAFDARACEAALSSIAAQAAATRTGNRAYVIAVPSTGGVAFLLPDTDADGPARLTPAARARLGAQMKAKGGTLGRVFLRGQVSVAGAVSGCSIARTSGSDAADLHLCRQLETVPGLVKPATDLYGRAIEGYIRMEEEDAAEARARA